MDDNLKSKLFFELIWLLLVLLGSAALEYFVIVLFDLHPILSIKIQAFIGLVIVAYGIRMLARMGEKGLVFFESENDDHEKGS